MPHSYHCPARCGKRFISPEFVAKHLDAAHPDWHLKRRSWLTPYGFADFDEPVTYQHAMRVMQEAAASFNIVGKQQ